MPRNVFWDGSRNTFIGPVIQSFGDRPLYRVMEDESAEFTPLAVPRAPHDGKSPWSVPVFRSVAAPADVFLRSLENGHSLAWRIELR